LITKINNLNKLNFFLFFFIFIYFFRSLFLVFSLSDFPWYYEWQHVVYFVEFKNGDFSSLWSHALRNQFQFFTKLIYLISFKLNGFIWDPKLLTIFIQIIPSIYISLTLTILFYKNIQSNLILVIILIFSFIPSALSNYYHFSESHFYFQILFSIISFYIYQNYDGIKLYLLLLLTFILSAINMAAVSIILYSTFSIFFFIKYLLFKNNKYLYLFFSLLIFVLFFYYLSFLLQVPSIFETRNVNNIDHLRSLYLIIKSLLHQNNLLYGLTILLLLFILIKNSSFSKEYFKNDFVILITIFIFLLCLSMSLGRSQIYDRYKDFLQIGGLLSLYFLNINILSKIFKNILSLIFIIVVSYNLLFFLDKVYERRLDTVNYDKSINETIKIYKSTGKITSDDISHKKAKRFVESIILSIENEIIN
tara:strand:- start:950 stop:2209 length:1260 start_codon:yes stop_codon:yes gene_type:complete